MQFACYKTKNDNYVVFALIIIAAVCHTASIKIRYVQFARILLYWTGIPSLVGQLGLRSNS